MDVLLAHGYFLHDDPDERRIMKPYAPLGLLYLSSHLKRRGFDVRIFDSTFQRYEAFEALVARERPAVVGLSSNLMTKPTVLRMAGAAARAGSTVVIGGPDPSCYAEEYLRHGADVVVIGEGERTLEELLPALDAYRRRRDLGHIHGIAYLDNRGQMIRTPPRALIEDLDGQPFPDREAIDISAYLRAWRGRHGIGSVSLLTARGCPYTCAWCSRSVFGATHRRRSPGRVADEVQLIVDRYRPDMLWYADDVFTIHPGWTLKYAAEMARRRLRIPFECISRPERITEPVADALQQLGCTRLWIGSESGSQRILDAMARGITAEQVRNAARLLRARGIEVGLFVMLGYDGEDVTDLAATVDHLKRTDPDVFLTTVAYPIKGTAYYEAVRDRIHTDGAWSARTDRDLRVAGRPGPLFYRFARRWMTSEVARDRHWREQRYLRAARSAVGAAVGRLGVVLLRRPAGG